MHLENVRKFLTFQFVSSAGLWASICVVVLFAFVSLFYYRAQPMVLTEQEARSIAERSCIKGGEALRVGFYDENQKKWVFAANLNATREKCIATCAVDVSTRTAALEWSCEK